MLVEKKKHMKETKTGVELKLLQFLLVNSEAAMPGGCLQAPCLLYCSPSSSAYLSTSSLVQFLTYCSLADSLTFPLFELDVWSVVSAVKGWRHGDHQRLGKALCAA